MDGIQEKGVSSREPLLVCLRGYLEV